MDTLDAHSQEHLTEEQLFECLFESVGPREEAHLRNCARCREDLDGYRRTLTQLGQWQTPERGTDYAQRVWESVAPRVTHREQSLWLRPAIWGWASVVLAGVMLLLALVLPGGEQQDDPRLVSRQAPGEVTRAPERLLDTVVKDHMSRATLLFAEVQRDENAEAPVEQQTIDDLLAENRLYRQTAEQEGDHATASLLSDMETVLVGLKHDPVRLTAPQVRDLQKRLASANLSTEPRNNDGNHDGEKSHGARRVKL